MALRLRVSLFLDGKLAAVIAALAADGVEPDGCATVGAYADSWSYSLVVSPALVATGLGMVSLRMCHFFFVLIISYLGLYSCLVMGGRSRILILFRPIFSRLPIAGRS